MFKKLNGLITSINRWCVPKFNARLLFSTQPELNVIEENQSDEELNDETNFIIGSDSRSRETSANISSQNSLIEYQVFL